MPRSSFSDHPLLRVSRPVSACSRCRAAKVKCDGKLPACTACEKAGRESECSAANDQFARGKERSYVAALELRIEKLERRLEYARSRRASVAMHDPDAPPIPPANEAERRGSLATIRAAIHRKEARRQEDSDVKSLVSDFGFLSVNATTRDFEPSTSNMTFARLVLAAATNDPIPDPENSDLPPSDVARSLIQYYLDNIHVLLPAFPATTLTSLLDAFYQPDQRHIRSTDYWIFYLVLAIASTAQSQNSQDESYSNGVEYVSKALGYADKALMPGYATQIQSLFLLTQYAVFDPAHFDSWHLIGFTCRAVIDLGYHQDPPQSHISDKNALDARRRTFYSVYALDRTISMVQARAFSFTDDAISVAFPSPSRKQPASSTTNQPSGRQPPAPDPALLQFQLRRAQSHWYQALFQSDPSDPLADPQAFVWQMCQDMREWAETLPQGLPPYIRELFDLELRYSYVYCIAPSARAPHMTAYGRLLIFEHAIAYLSRVAAAAAAGSNAALHTYHDTLRVYFMGSQFMAVLRDAADVLLAPGGPPVAAPLAVPGRPAPAPLPARLDNDIGDNLDRSLRALEQVGSTLRRYGERWEDALSLASSFDMMAAEVVESLRTRRALRDAQVVAQQQNLSQPPPLSQGPSSIQMGPGQHMQSMQGHLPQQPQQPDVRWIGVDVPQLMQGRGAPQ